MMLRLLLVSALSTIVACGGSSTETGGTSTVAQPPRQPEVRLQDPIALLPPRAVIIARLDVTRLHRSPYHEQLYALFSSFATEEGMSNSTQSSFRAAYDATELIVAGLGQNSDGSDVDDFVVLARGGYQSGQLERQLREISGQRAITESDLRGLTVFAADDLRAVDLNHVAWAFTDEHHVDSAVARAFGEGDNARSSTQLLDIASRGGVESSTFGIAVEMVDGLRRQIGAGEADAIARGALRIDLDDGMSVVATIEAVSADAARQLGARVQDGLNELAGEVMLMPTPLPGVLRAAVVQVEGTNLSITLRANDDDTRTLLSLASNFIQMAM